MIRYSLNLKVPKNVLEKRVVKANKWLCEEIIKDTDQFVPARTGALAMNVHRQGNTIVYASPYARFQYYGKVMIDSFCGNGSGEIVIAFTTANRVPHYSEKAILPMGMLHDDAINPLFRAVAECVEESVLSSLLHAETVTGYHGRTVRCLSDLLDEK